MASAGVEVEHLEALDLTEGTQSVEEVLALPLEKTVAGKPGNMSAHKFGSVFRDANPENADGRLLLPLNSPEEMALLQQLQAHGEKACPEFFSKTHPFWQLACLRARKYDVPRALELLQNFSRWRADHGVEEATSATDPMLHEVLEREVFKCEGNRDKLGRFALTVRLRRADPSRFSAALMLRQIHAVMESALIRFPEAQARGIVLVADMTDATRSNMDPRIPREIMTALTNNFPVRLGAVYIVSPLWFLRLIFPVARMFMKRKMSERIHLLPKGYAQLRDYIDAAQLPADMEGTFPESKPMRPFIERVQARYGSGCHPDPDQGNQSPAPAPEACDPATAPATLYAFV